MKKIYETPVAEKIDFCYRDQVVVASGDFPGGMRNNDGGNVCRYLATACNEH